MLEFVGECGHGQPAADIQRMAVEIHDLPIVSPNAEIPGVEEPRDVVHIAQRAVLDIHHEKVDSGIPVYVRRCTEGLDLQIEDPTVRMSDGRTVERSRQRIHVLLMNLREPLLDFHEDVAMFTNVTTDRHSQVVTSGQEIVGPEIHGFADRGFTRSPDRGSHRLGLYRSTCMLVLKEEGPTDRPSLRVHIPRAEGPSHQDQKPDIQYPRGNSDQLTLCVYNESHSSPVILRPILTSTCRSNCRNCGTENSALPGITCL